jgi:transposase-like protein
MIYTTNTIESLNGTLRRSVRARRHFRKRRSGNETDLAAVARDYEKLEDAGTRMACGKSSVRFGVW